jgi:opacity protein-like surface antigen
MKKFFFTAVTVVAFSGLSFASNGVNVKIIKKTRTIKITACANESQFYDITCANGNSAHRAFDSLQAAYDWANTSGFCN